MKPDGFRFVPRRLGSVLSLAVAAAVLVGVGGSWGGQASAQSEPELVQWVSDWAGASPDALNADWRGPFGARRFGPQVAVERYSPGVLSEQRRINVPFEPGLPGWYFIPRLVQGPGGPELFWQNDFLLHAEKESRHAQAVGWASWEGYSAARLGNVLFSVNFGLWEVNTSFVALFRGSAQPVVTELRRYGQATWSPRALVSSDRVTAVFRGVMQRPLRGYGLAIESMSIADLSSIRAWQPTLTQYAGPAETGVGDPAACLDDAGNVHWATVLWTTGLGAEPTGRLVVDGVELVQRGATGHFDWVPEMAWVRGRGLMLLIVAPSGKAMVGLVQGNQLIPVAEVPSAAPEFGNPPVNRLASYGESYYVSTIYGLWAHHVVPPVGASGFASLLAGAIVLGALAVLAVRKRRVEA